LDKAETMEKTASAVNAAMINLAPSCDPEALERLSADIYELGLIYRIDISDDGYVDIDMTLTAPGCPVAGEMPVWVQNAVNAVPGVADVKVHMVFNPPWDQSRMSDEARISLDMW